jgi:hypothetical protein
VKDWILVDEINDGDHDAVEYQKTDQAPID